VKSTVTNSRMKCQSWHQRFVCRLEEVTFFIKPTAVVLILLVSCQSEGQVKIPIVLNSRIHIDGLPGLHEWSKSLKILLKEEYTLHLMADSAFLYVAAFGENKSPYTDLYIRTETGLINLHASMQLGERLLPEGDLWDDTTPAWNWGNNLQWTANTVSYKRGASESLPFTEQVVPYKGQEFKIEIEKLGKNFSLFVTIRDFADAAALASFPPNGVPRDVSTWQLLSIH
jgi:hypothetical protein